MKNKMKRCNKCKNEKELTEFSNNKSNKDGLAYSCKRCKAEKSLNYRHTKEGLLTEIYGKQKYTSKKRGYNLPNYTKEELGKWLFSRHNFKTLFTGWVESGYNSDLRPSVDRKNDYESYTLNNIQLMTWKENNEKYSSDAILGRNNKMARVVLKCDMDGNVLMEYHSLKHAERETGFHNSNLSYVCQGKANTIGGYKWRYKN